MYSETSKKNRKARERDMCERHFTTISFIVHEIDFQKWRENFEMHSTILIKRNNTQSYFFLQFNPIQSKDGSISLEVIQYKESVYFYKRTVVGDCRLSLRWSKIIFLFHCFFLKFISSIFTWPRFSNKSSFCSY